MRSFVLSLLFIISICPVVSAGDYQIVYQQQVDGAEHYVNIDPILGPGQQLEGFFFSNEDSHRVEFIYFDSLSSFAVSTRRGPYRTINYISADNDTLYLYVLCKDTLWRLSLPTDLSIHDSAVYEVRSLVTSWPAFRGYPLNMELAFFKAASQLEPGIRVSTTRLNGNFMNFPDDYWEEESSATLVVDADLQVECMRKTALFLAPIFLDGAIEEHWISLANGYWFHHYKVYHPDWTEYVDEQRRWGCVDLFDSSDTVLFHQCRDGALYRSLFVCDAAPAIAGEEIIMQRRWTNSFLYSWWGSAHTTTCYAWSGDSLATLWEWPTQDLILLHLLRSGDIVVGTAGRHHHENANDSLVVFLNCRTGLAIDTVWLGRNLSAVKFFETGADELVLNLAGRTHDTIFVYQFQTPTDVPEQGNAPSLPTTFTLHQNYPNPFNNATLISFDNHVRQHVSLKIYNLLGQHVGTLVEKELAVGSYSFRWQGTDINGEAMASGIYLAELKSAAESSTIKLLLLK